MMHVAADRERRLAALVEGLFKASRVLAHKGIIASPLHNTDPPARATGTVSAKSWGLTGPVEGQAERGRQLRVDPVRAPDPRYPTSAAHTDRQTLQTPDQEALLPAQVVGVHRESERGQPVQQGAEGDFAL